MNYFQDYKIKRQQVMAEENLICSVTQEKT